MLKANFKKTVHFDSKLSIAVRGLHLFVSALLTILCCDCIRAQDDDLAVNSPIVWTGDDAPQFARILNISAAPEEGASLSLTNGTSSGLGAMGTVSSLLVGSANGEQGALSILGGSTLSVPGDNSLYNPDVKIDGRSVRKGSAGIGMATNSIGTLRVEGIGSAFYSNTLSLGLFGSGNLSIEGGGKVITGASSTIGRASGSFGSVSLSGTDSSWSIGLNSQTASLMLGYEGSGVMSVSQGARFTCIGLNPDPRAGLVQIGNFSQGILNITSGGQFESGNIQVGQYSPGGPVLASGTGTGFLNISDSGSLLRANSFFGVGVWSVGYASIVNDGAVHAKNVTSGYAAGIGKGDITVRNGSLIADEDIIVGYQGIGTITLSEGATAASTRGYIAAFAGSTGTATVTGENSTWDVSTDFYVGGGETSGIGGSGLLNVAELGRVSVGGTLTNYSRILVESGGVLEAGAIENHGELIIKDGSGGGGGGESLGSPNSLVDVAGTLTNHAGARLNLQSGAILETDNLVNSGDLIIEEGAAVRNLSNFILIGGVAEINGSFDVQNFAVNGGALQGTGQISLEKLTIGSDSALRGNLTVNANLEIAAGGQLAPGNSPGTVTVNGSLVLNGQYDWEIDGPQADLTIVNGDLEWNGNLSVLPLGLGFPPGQIYTLFAYTGAFSGSFAPLAGYQITINELTAGANANGLSGYKFANITAVPEPGTLLPLGLVAFGLLARSRRRAEAAA